VSPIGDLNSLVWHDVNSEAFEKPGLILPSNLDLDLDLEVGVTGSSPVPSGRSAPESSSNPNPNPNPNPEASSPGLTPLISIFGRIE